MCRRAPRVGHPFSAGQQVWLHRTKYTDGPPNYWYAFAGNPAAVPARSWDPNAPTASSPRRPATCRRRRAPRRRSASRCSASTRHAPPLGAGATGAAGRGDLRRDDARGHVRPAAALALGTRYRLELAAGVTDSAGNPGQRRGGALRRGSMPIRWRTARRWCSDRARTRLVRVDALGAIVEERELEVADDRWLSAVRRSRLPGQPGSWLEIGTSQPRRLVGGRVGRRTPSRADRRSDIRAGHHGGASQWRPCPLRRRRGRRHARWAMGTHVSRGPSRWTGGWSPMARCWSASPRPTPMPAGRWLRIDPIARAAGDIRDADCAGRGARRPRRAHARAGGLDRVPLRRPGTRRRTARGRAAGRAPSSRRAPAWRSAASRSCWSRAASSTAGRSAPIPAITVLPLEEPADSAE